MQWSLTVAVDAACQKTLHRIVASSDTCIYHTYTCVYYTLSNQHRAQKMTKTTNSWWLNSTGTRLLILNLKHILVCVSLPTSQHTAPINKFTQVLKIKLPVYSNLYYFIKNLCTMRVVQQESRMVMLQCLHGYVHMKPAIIHRNYLTKGTHVWQQWLLWAYYTSAMMNFNLYLKSVVSLSRLIGWDETGTKVYSALLASCQ